MKATVKTLMALTVLLGMDARPARAEEATTPDRRFGAGVMVGEPTGASFKSWLSDVSAIDAVVGLSLEEDNFACHTDYLYHFNNLVPLDEKRLAFYAGGGPRYAARNHKDDLFGIRTVGGVSYLFDNAPVDVFFEAGPVFDLTPNGAVRYTVGIGVRFWF